MQSVDVGKIQALRSTVDFASCRVHVVRVIRPAQHHCSTVSGMATHPTNTEFLCGGSSINRYSFAGVLHRFSLVLSLMLARRSDRTGGDLGLVIWDYTKRAQVPLKRSNFPLACA